MQILKIIGIIILSFSLGFGLCYILAAREIKILHNDIRKSWEYMNEACEILNGGKVDEQPIL